jgi:hypothetical protein
MRCSLCGKRIYWMEWLENFGACSKCLHNKIAPKNFVEGIKVGIIFGILGLMVIILFIYHLFLTACPS